MTKPDDIENRHLNELKQTMLSTRLHKKNRFKRLLLYIAVIFICACILAPYIWLIISSLSYRVDLTAIPLHWLPKKLNTENYQQIFFGSTDSSSPNSNLRYGFLNSLIIAGSSTLICLFAGTLAAYAFTRLNFLGKKQLYMIILTTQFLPLAVLIIPLYIIMRNLGLLNTRMALIIANCSFILPMMIWLMRSYFSSVPKDLEEVARIDGCSRIGTIFRIIIPLSTPGLAASGIFAFVIAWNEFFTAFILSSTLNSKTISVVLSEFSSKVGIDYVAMGAAGVIASLPPVILAIIFQKYIVQGLTGGAVKG
jgi:multiple sugar transport system permease protein